MTDFQPSARVIADSISPTGYRLTTLEVTLHRFVLAELNTHRAFSRNSASSRAIPVSRMMRLVAENPAIPLSWPREQKGMQGGEPFTADDAKPLRDTWLAARDAAVNFAEDLAAAGVHKSVVNRLLEPFLPHTVIVSATDWDGFWRQRCSPLAQPEIRAAAEAMYVAYLSSEPAKVGYGEWHLPYIDDEDREDFRLDALKKISAARCARVSYLSHERKRDWQADIGLYNRLVGARPAHASPLEHVATPTEWDTPGNFRGWAQFRHDVLGAQ